MDIPEMKEWIRCATAAKIIGVTQINAHEPPWYMSEVRSVECGDGLVLVNEKDVWRAKMRRDRARAERRA